MRGENKMPFKDGTYIFYSEQRKIEIKVIKGSVYVKGTVPLTVRFSDLFNENNWEVNPDD